MTVIHPTTFPDEVFSACTFLLNDGIVEARHSRGLAGTITQFNEPVWSAQFDTGPMLFERRTRWEAWKDSLQGRPFLAWDTSRPEPVAYPSGHPATIAATWDGTATALFVNATDISITGLPANFIMSAGDRIGLVQGGRYGYYTVLQTLTAGAGGSLFNIPLAPFPNPIGTPIFTTAAVVQVRRPKLLMRMVPGSWQLSNSAVAVPASFDAVQIL